MVRIITKTPKLPGEKILDKMEKVEKVEKLVNFASGLFDYLSERERTKREREITERFKMFAKLKKEEIESQKEVELAKIKAEREKIRLRAKEIEIKSEILLKSYDLAISTAQSPEERVKLFEKFAKSIAEL